MHRMRDANRAQANGLCSCIAPAGAPRHCSFPRHRLTDQRLSDANSGAARRFCFSIRPTLSADRRFCLVQAAVVV